MVHIKKYREQAGLTQQQLAKRLNVSEITVQSWEQELRTPPIKRLREIAKALKVQPGDLL